MNNGGMWKYLVVALVIWCIFMLCKNSSDYEAGKQVYIQSFQNDIYTQVCNDAVKQYEIAARQGDRMQMYVQAGMCAAAFLQAHDEPNYNKWKSVEKDLGRQIGMPQY